MKDQFYRDHIDLSVSVGARVRVRHGLSRAGRCESGCATVHLPESQELESSAQYCAFAWPTGVGAGKRRLK